MLSWTWCFAPLLVRFVSIVLTQPRIDETWQSYHEKAREKLYMAHQERPSIDLSFKRYSHWRCARCTLCTYVRTHSCDERRAGFSTTTPHPNLAFSVPSRELNSVFSTVRAMVLGCAAVEQRGPKYLHSVHLASQQQQQVAENKISGNGPAISVLKRAFDGELRDS